MKEQTVLNKSYNFLINFFSFTGRRLPGGGINSRSNKYTNLLKHKFTNIVGTPKWASLSKQKSEDSDSDDDEILQTCGFIAKTEKQYLPQSTIEFKKVKDLNCETYCEGPYINAIEFHPTSSVALVAGNSGVASLFAVDGKRNSKLHNIGLQKYPILCAKFSSDGNEAILGSRSNFIYTYDLMAAKAIRVPLPHGLTQFKKFTMSSDGQYIAAAGKWGEVHILSSATKERLYLLKQDSEVTSLVFNSSASLLYGHSDSGEVTIWDMNTRRVRCKWMDDGCIQGTVVAVAPSNQVLKLLIIIQIIIYHSNKYL